MLGLQPCYAMQLHGCGNAGRMRRIAGNGRALGVAAQADRARRASGSYGDLLYIATPETIVVVSYPQWKVVATIWASLKWWRLF